jgi:hypothetical protein
MPGRCQRPASGADSLAVVGLQHLSVSRRGLREDRQVKAVLLGAGGRRPIGWNGCPSCRIARPSHRSVARTRCRRGCANDHSPPTARSAGPAGIAATRASVVGQVRFRLFLSGRYYARV